MVESLLQTIIGWVQHLGFLGVFFGALAEEFFYIIPSSIVQLSAGVILLGKISFSWALLGKAMLIIGIPAAVGVSRRVGCKAVEKLVGRAYFYWTSSVTDFTERPLVCRAWGFASSYEDVLDWIVCGNLYTCYGDGVCWGTPWWAV